MKVIIELTNLDEVKAVVAALEGKNAQAIMALAPTSNVTSITKTETAAVAAEVKAEPAPKTGRKPKAKVEEKTEEVVETKNEDTGAEADQASTVEPKDGDIDDASMREVGGKLLREMNAKGKDGVGELTKILNSLSSKKVTEVPMNLRSRFLDKVAEALA